jgi:hypothetical protein
MRRHLPLFLSVLSFIILPLLAHASTFSGPIDPTATLCHCANNEAPDYGCVLILIQNLMNFFIYFATIVITIFIAWAGFEYMTSGGSPEKRSQANQRILNAVIGLMIVLGAWLLVNSVMSVLYKKSSFGDWNSILAAKGSANCIQGKIAPPLPGLTGADGGGGNGTPGSNGATNSGVPGTPSQNAIGACKADALTPVFGSNAAAMSCVSHYENGSCNPSAASGTDKGADNNPVSFGVFQVNISATDLSQYSTCRAAVSDQPLNCTAAFSAPYTGHNKSTVVTNPSLYSTCKQAVTNIACNEQVAKALLSNKQGIGNWGIPARNNCSSLLVH